MAPELSHPRLCSLMRELIQATSLDLSGMNVLTEAASGAYAVTPVIAALANARRVHAVTKSTRYGSATDIIANTMALAELAGVADRISITEQVPHEVLSEIQLVTNSGHLRPITPTMIDALPENAVIALMFESWEFRPTDIDAQSCRRRGIPIVGVHERHPEVDVFSYLGPLCVRLLHDAALPVYRNRIALVCDNDFDESMLKGLRGSGATVTHVRDLRQLERGGWDAIVIALLPTAELRVNAGDVAYLASVSEPYTVIAQYWGDVDREAIERAGLPIWPPVAPKHGHMAILLSAIGPDPIVRLQTGGLKAAEHIFHGGQYEAGGFAQPLDLEAIAG